MTVLAQLQIADQVSLQNNGVANLVLDPSVGSDANVSASLALARVGD